jgi:hypothetical protein
MSTLIIHHHVRNYDPWRPPDRRIHAPRAGDRRGSLKIRDFGDEVHLWFEQRVSWPVALPEGELLTTRRVVRADHAAQQAPPSACLRRSWRPHARGDGARMPSFSVQAAI